MIQNLFNEKKAAQAAAYFLFRAGEPVSVLKLMKLLYLAERRSFERYGTPMIGDRLVSMPHGPVLSITYNHMSGELESVAGGWDSWVADRAEHNLDLRDRAALKSPEDDLLELSDADLAVLADVWQQFGQMSAWAAELDTQKLPGVERPGRVNDPDDAAGFVCRAEFHA